jgi:hypothetical protein
MLVGPVLTSSLSATEHPLAPYVWTSHRLRLSKITNELRLVVVTFAAAACHRVASRLAIHELAAYLAHGSVQHHLCNFTHRLSS